MVFLNYDNKKSIVRQLDRYPRTQKRIPVVVYSSLLKIVKKRNYSPWSSSSRSQYWRNSWSSEAQGCESTSYDNIYDNPKKN